MHVNYASRALQRGSVPEVPTYFLKPPTTLAESGDEVVRPKGCELLVFEGEIALVLGTTARRVPVSRAWSAVGWVTAANDFGLHDLRHADHGSNARSKGIDGYTPIGPRLLDARQLDPDALRLRAWVDGELAQDAVTGEDLIFGFDVLVADLSRLMTLEEGDVILTGTPAGATVVGPGSRVEVEVSSTLALGPGGQPSSGRLVSPVVEATDELSPVGAMPRVDDALRASARGEAPATRVRAGEATLDLLGSVSSATIAAQLRARGHDDCTLDGPRPARSGARMVGRARTLRYLPGRVDLFAERGGAMNAQKRAVESLERGDVLVVEARGVTSAGTIGDLLALRAAERGAAGIVTDGAVRDSAAIAEVGIPTFHVGAHPAVLGRRHVPFETGGVVACGGVTVQPGEIVVGDADGVVVVPEHLADEVAVAAVEQERQERFIAEQLRAGASVAGLYPLSGDWLAAYAAWCAKEAPR